MRIDGRDIRADGDGDVGGGGAANGKQQPDRGGKQT